MSFYEGMFIVDNRQANRDWDGSVERVKAMAAKHGAQVIRCEKWGERKLAYDMHGQRRGTYLLAYFQSTGEAVNRIYRECELSELIIRALILQIPTVPAEGEVKPSIEIPDVAPGRSFRRGRRDATDFRRSDRPPRTDRG